MNTKSTRRSQKQLLKRKPAETAAADHLPEVRVIDCGNFDGPQTTPLFEVPVLDCGTFPNTAAAEVVAPPTLTPIASCASAIARGIKGDS